MISENLTSHFLLLALSFASSCFVLVLLPTPDVVASSTSLKNILELFQQGAARRNHPTLLPSFPTSLTASCKTTRKSKQLHLDPENGRDSLKRLRHWIQAGWIRALGTFETTAPSLDAAPGRSCRSGSEVVTEYLPHPSKCHEQNAIRFSSRRGPLCFGSSRAATLCSS